MRDVLLLHRHLLKPDLLEFVYKRFRQFRVHHKGGPSVGANRIWSAELVLIDAALRQDAKALGEAAESIAVEIGVTSGDGIQSDFSYHQHGRRLQTFHYGLAYLEDTTRILSLLHETPWAVAQEKIDFLAEYVLNGPRWQTRGTMTAPGTLDRMVSRPGSLAVKGMASIAAVLQRLVSDRLSQPLADYGKALGTDRPAVQGFRCYPCSDFAVYHRPTFSVMLKTNSSETLLTESINQENLRGTC